MNEQARPRGMDVALAVDVGATKAAVARVTSDGEVLARGEIRTAGSDDPFPALADLLRSVTEGDEVVCGVGSAGPMTAPGERVSPVNLPAWRDFPLRAHVGEVTGLPTFLDGDGKALALAEG